MNAESSGEKQQITLSVNGEPRNVNRGISLNQLIDSIGFAGQRIAAEVNCEVVPKSQHADCVLAAGDRIEIVSFVGGG